MSITKVYLLSVPLEKDYAHTLWFASETTQQQYFLSQKKAALAHDDFTYQRKDGIIRVPEQIDTLWQQGINYVMYRNDDYNNKWFYAFITNMEYKNDGRTDLTIETDVIQTWMFEKVMKPCFVEREHAADDTIGLHTVPENLECGEYVAKFHQKISDLNDLRIVLGVTSDGEGNSDGGGRYNGIYSGITYLAFTMDKIDHVNRCISMEYSGRTDAIVSMFLAPAMLCPVVEVPEVLSYYGAYQIVRSEAVNKFNYEISKSVGSFTPHNNKLNCFPYRYLLVSNNNGGSAIYQYEHFSGDKLKFEVQGAITPGGSIRIVPQNYKGVASNNEEGLNLGKYPICNWTSDEYINWLTQNSVNIGLNLATGIGQIVAGAAAAVATGGVGAVIGGGQVASGVTTIAGQLAQIHQMSFTPPQAHGNINCGDVTTAAFNNTFTFYGMGIKDEYLQILDDYFDMYGYKIHRVKIPEVNHRSQFWYTKTIDANITGPIPQDDMQKIKDCYNRGITYWKHPENFKNFNVSNSII